MPRLHTHLKHGFAVTLVRCSLGLPPLVSASVFLSGTRAHGLLGWPSPLLSVPRWPLAGPPSAWETPGPWLQWSPGAPPLLSKMDPMTTAHTSPLKPPAPEDRTLRTSSPSGDFNTPYPLPASPVHLSHFSPVIPGVRAGSVSHRLDHHLHFVCVLRQMFQPSVLSSRVSSARALRAPVDCACGPVDCACGELPPHSPTCPSVRPSVRPPPGAAPSASFTWLPRPAPPRPHRLRGPHSVCIPILTVSPLSGSPWACVSASPRRLFTQPCRAQVAFRRSGR